MPLVSTTHAALRAAITDGIRGISPTAAIEQGQGWEPQDDPDAVQSSSVRHFCISDMGSSSEVERGLVGQSSMEYSTDVTVLSSYGAMEQLQVPEVTDADRADILAMLRSAISAGNTGPIPGLTSLGPSDTTLIDLDDGQALVEHTITVQYMKATRR